MRLSTQTAPDSPQFETRFARQFDVGPSSQSENDHVRGQRALRSYDRRNEAPFRLESDRHFSQITPHSVIGECFGHSRAHVRIQARHRLIECLDERCFDIPISKRLRYFETDVASAHDDCALRFLRVKEVS